MEQPEYECFAFILFFYLLNYLPPQNTADPVKKNVKSVKLFQDQNTYNQIYKTLLRCLKNAAG